MSEQPAKIVEAERFVLRDSNGRIRAELGAGEASSIGLKLYDGKGHVRVEVVVAKDGASGLQLWDEHGMPRVILALDPDQPYVAAPSLSLTGKDGRGGVVLSVAPDGSPSVDFLKDGKVFLAIPDPDNGYAEDDSGG
jgi:hypothetical protein